MMKPAFLKGGKKSFLSLQLQDKMIGDHYSVAHGIPEVVDLMNEIMEQSSMKRKVEAKVWAEEVAKKPKHGCTVAGNKFMVQTCWESSKAKKHFLGNSNDECDIVEVLVEQWIEWLQQANKTSDGWCDIIDKHDKDHLCISFDLS